MNARQLRACREKAGLRRYQVAEKMGIPAPTYGNLEREPGNIKAKYIPSLCKALGINTDIFFSGDFN